MPKKKETGAFDYIATMKKNAETLYAIRQQINTREESFKKETDELYATEKKLKEEILNSLKTVGLSSIKTEKGESYSISHKHRFIASDPIALDTYARENRCVTIDKRVLNQRLTKAFNDGVLPEFVNAEEYETISIRGAKETATESP